jgi:hypothetical protein
MRGLNMFAQPKVVVTEAWSVIVSLLKSGTLKPLVARNFRLADAAEALRYLIEAGLSAGSSSQFEDLCSVREKETPWANYRGKLQLSPAARRASDLARAQLFVNEGVYVFIAGRRQKELDEAVTAIGSNAIRSSGGRRQTGRS